LSAGATVPDAGPAAEAQAPPALRAPLWLPGGHAQTIWPALISVRRARRDGLVFRRERWDTPDGDFIDVDFLADGAGGAPGAASAAAPPRPLLVLFHGLEGSTTSLYALTFAAEARRRGWAYAVPHFRGCSGEINRAPRAYHSGDHAEVGWMLRRLQAQHRGPLAAVGVSLGGNALLRWAEEAGATAPGALRAVASICAPLDLAIAGAAMGVGFNRRVYTRMFLRTMVPKALAKWQQYPGLFDRDRVRRARTLHDFDDAFTAPLHGFRDVADYWRRASAKPHLHRIRLPALVVNARNDPFVPAASLPRPREVGPAVTLWQPAHGGHVGFPGAGARGRIGAMPAGVVDWLARHVERSAPAGDGPPAGGSAPG
jgi:predicted alpha/beta-fold hydrolase